MTSRIESGNRAISLETEVGTSDQNIVCGAGLESDGNERGLKSARCICRAIADLSVTISILHLLGRYTREPTLL